MTDQDRQEIEQTLSATVSEVVTAFAVVVTALRHQPGFDRAAFDTLLRPEINNPEAGDIAKNIYRLILQEPLE